MPLAWRDNLFAYWDTSQEPWLESSGRRHGAGYPHHEEAERFGRLLMPLLQNRA